MNYRKKAGLSQKALAEAVAVSNSLINHYEKDKRNPTLHTLVKLAEVLNVTSDKLLGLGQRPAPAVYRNRFEYTLLREIRFLNMYGQERALEYISELKELPRYTEEKQTH
jgi:transcriptional regulator with XRE-family HTH domain